MPVVQSATGKRPWLSGAFIEVVDVDVGVVYYDGLVEGRQTC